MQEATQFPKRRHLPKMFGYDAEEEPHPNLPPIPSLPRFMQHIKEIRSIKSIKYKFSSSSRSGAITTKTEIRDRSGWRWRRSRRRLRWRPWRERRGRPRRAPGLPVVERTQLAQAVLRTSTLLDSLLELCQFRQRRIYPLFGRLSRTRVCQHTSAHTLRDLMVPRWGSCSAIGNTAVGVRLELHLALHHLKR